MTLIEFLRQWERGRLSAAVLASLALHALLLVALIGVKPSRGALGTRRGDALIVELPKPSEPAAAGAPSRPAPAPRAPAPPQPASPRVARAEAPRPAPARPAPPAPVPAAPAPAPRAPEPVPRVASAPAPVPEAPPPPPTAAPETAPAPAATRPEPAPPTSAPDASGRAPERQVAALPPPGRSGGQAFVPDIRSLRGSEGVHGGGGAGRGGVEGDPVTLDNADPKYSDYLLRVKRQIEEKMTYPCVKDAVTKVCEPKPAQLVIEFGIRKDGALAFVQVREAASYAVFDEVSQNAVKLASPFPPLPEVLRQLHPTGLPILAHFRYDYTLTFRSIIR